MKAVSEYKTRRAERLAARGIRPEFTPNADMPQDISSFQKRRDKRLLARGIKPVKDVIDVRMDAPDDDNDNNNNQGRSGESSGGGHGNTRLPFGLCKRYGIDIGADWGPREAWDALAGKGITPDGAYERLKRGEDPGTPDVEPEVPKEPVKKLSVPEWGGAEYTDLKGVYYSWVSRGSNPWRLTGSLVDGTAPEGKYTPGMLRKSFWTKEDMYRYLKEKGVEEFVDPETGETVNPSEMELPDVKLEYDGAGYTDISIGLRGGRYTVVGTDMAGKKRKLYDVATLAAAQDWLEKFGMNPDDAKLSPSLKKREAERVSWRTSAKKEYVEADGVKYGDLELKKDDSWYSKVWRISGEAEDGSTKLWTFKTRNEAMKFLQEQGVEKIRQGKEKINPKEYIVPPTVAHIRDTDYQEIGIKMDRYGEPKFYGKDLDGEDVSLDNPRYEETYDAFKERILKDYGLTEEQLKISDEDKEKIETLREAEAEKERKRKEFEEKAISFGYTGRFLDPQLGVDSDGDYSIYGYDSKGRRQRISSWGDLYDMEEFCKYHNYTLDQFVKTPEMQEAYDKYKEARKDFDTKAVEIAGRKYADLGITFDGGVYCVRGMDERGRTKEPIRANSLNELEKKLGESGLGTDAIPMDDAAKARSEKAKKARELIATGDWYSMGGSDTAYTDLRVEKARDTGDWLIIGKDVDGEEKTVGKPKSTWDEAVTEMASQGVKSYRVTDGDKELGMPKNGLHGVTLMRKPGGGFSVMGATATQPRATVYESDNEADARKWLEDNNVPSSSVKTRGMNPNDDVVRTHTAKSLDNFDTHRMKAIEGSFVDDMTDAEKQETIDMLTEVFDKGAYRASRGLGNFGNIIENGYKSQVETGTGGRGAAISRSGRLDVSKKMFGHGDMEDSEYEKCGYLGLPDDGEDFDDPHWPSYGSMAFTFKKDRLKDRATYTFGDSLNTRYHMASAGYAGEKPTIEGMTSLYDIGEMRETLKPWRDYKAGKIGYKEMFRKIRREANNQYIEMQFNGPITVDDIEKAAFQSEKDIKHAFSHMADTQRKNVIRILRDKGIQVVYRQPDGSFTDAWDWIRKHYPADMPG